MYAYYLAIILEHFIKSNLKTLVTEVSRNTTRCATIKSTGKGPELFEGVSKSIELEYSASHRPYCTKLYPGIQHRPIPEITLMTFELELTRQKSQSYYFDDHGIMLYGRKFSAL